MQYDTELYQNDDDTDVLVSAGIVARLNLSDVPKLKKALSELKDVRIVCTKVYPGYLKIVPTPYAENGNSEG